MRWMDVKAIIDAVEKMCIQGNIQLGMDVVKALKENIGKENSPIGRGIMEKLIRNAEIAVEQDMPICQDTGMAVFFIDVGQEIQFTGGSLTEAINEGVRRGYREGYLRKSVVSDPLQRKNSGDNTPAIIHYDIVPGNQIKIIFAPKGFGSENMSAIKMLNPSDGEKGVLAFVEETVSKAGPNPCPPIVVGVGIGGTMEKAALLAKRALTREIGSSNGNEYYQALERKLLQKVNNLGIGPQGLGGNTTALAVHVEAFPTHIAGLPVAVNINCHAARHIEVTL